MTTDSCDVLIVGGGPAGSTCAWQLMKAGFDAGDGQTGVSARQGVRGLGHAGRGGVVLQFDCAEYAQGRVMQPIRGFRIGTIGGAEAETRYDEAVSFGIRRCEFDHYLLQRSRARVWDSANRSKPWCARATPGWWTDEIGAPLVVGAGGHFCPVSRMRGVGRSGAASPSVAAQEIEFAAAGRGARRMWHSNAEVVAFYFCTDLKGYGWCFAKGDYLNVGLGREDSHRLSEHVEQFLGWLRQRGGIPRDLPGKFNGHAYLLYPDSRRKLYDEGVLLIGDAAGLAYPRSGEGIRPEDRIRVAGGRAYSEAAGDYRSGARLAPYLDRLTQRFVRARGQLGLCAMVAARP